jgi:hypothetical protein
MKGIPLMANHDLGANQFTFTGDRTRISYETHTPIPNQGPLLQYQGPEGDETFTGDQVTCLDSALGTLLTVTLRPDAGVGAINITVLVPEAFGVTPDSPVTFGTIAIKTTGRGFINTPGVELTYDVLPLVGQASQVFLP